MGRRSRRCRCRAPAPYGTPLVFSTSTGKPKPWQQGEVAGVCIDSQDHVFTINRGNLVNSPETLDSVPSAPVMEFDSDGNFVNAWGDRDILPNGLHGCFVDYQDNIWIAGNGDGIVQKYSHNGTLLAQIGIRGVCDNPPGEYVRQLGGQSQCQSEHHAAERACQHVRRSEKGSAKRKKGQCLHRGRVWQPSRCRVYGEQPQHVHLPAPIWRSGRYACEQPADRLCRPVCLGRRRPSALRSHSRG